MAEQTKPAPLVKMVGKLNVKTGANPARVKEDAYKPRYHLCDIYGKCIGTKAKEDTRNGNVYIALVGDFEGWFPETNTIYKSGKLYLPDGIQEAVEAATVHLDKANVESVEFGFSVYSVTATNAAGYSYEAVPLIKPQENDSLSALRRLMTVQQKALGITSGIPIAGLLPEASDEAANALEPQPAKALEPQPAKAPDPEPAKAPPTTPAPAPHKKR